METQLEVQAFQITKGQIEKMFNCVKKYFVCHRCREQTYGHQGGKVAGGGGGGGMNWETGIDMYTLICIK